MDILILAVFILGYAFIALEHNIHIDKAASALVTGTVCWALFVLGWHEVPAHLAEEYHLFAADHMGDGHGVWPCSLNIACCTTWKKSAASSSS